MANRHEEVVSQGIARAPDPSSSQPSSQGHFFMPFPPGQVINGKYEVVELIGVGGLGFVVAANHVELGEKVALKFLRPEAMSNVEAVSRFSREARASAKLRSEHVARVFDVGTLPDGSPFIVMEYLEGIDLGVLLHERGALPISLAIEYVLQTCEALATAHASGVVHRDIKPDNLFLNRRAARPARDQGAGLRNLQGVARAHPRPRPATPWSRPPWRWARRSTCRPSRSGPQKTSMPARTSGRSGVFCTSS